MRTIVDNVDAGCSLTGGGWAPDPSGYGSSLHYAGPAGTGTNKARWSLTGLTAGDLVIPALTWTALSNRATNVPWRMYDSDGTTILASGTINQEVAPVGYVESGGTFQILARRIITGTSVHVEIDDNCNEYVIADAVCFDHGAVPANTTVSLSDGDGSISGRWSSGLPGGTNTTAFVEHAVTVDFPFTLGSSPSDDTTYELEINGSLTLEAGAVLTMKGNITIAAGAFLQVGTAAAGASLIFDSSAAGAATNYKCVGKIISRGTEADRSIIESDVDGDNASFVEVYDIEYANVTRIGTSTIPSFRYDSIGNNVVKFKHSIAVQCGAFDWSGGPNIIPSDGWDFEFSTTRQTLSSTPILHKNTAGFPTATRRFHHCVFDKQLQWAPAGTTVTACIFLKEAPQSIDFGVGGFWTLFENNLVLRYNNNGDWLPGGDVNEIVEIFDTSILNEVLGVYDSLAQTDNPHWNMLYSGVVFENSILEDFWSNGQGDCFRVANGQTATIRRNIGLSRQLEQHSPGTLYTAMTTGTFLIEHNTWQSGQVGAVCFGEADAGYAGQMLGCRSNIFWAPVDISAATPLPCSKIGQWYIATPLTTDVGDAADINNNCGYNIKVTGGVGTNGYDIPLTGIPGVDDVDENPDFVDPTVCFANWVASIEPNWAGVPAPTRDEYNARGLHKLRCMNEPSHADYDADYLGPDDDPLSLYKAYIRAGFRPQNANLGGASHDALTIGALELSVPTDVIVPSAVVTVTAGTINTNMAIAVPSATNTITSVSVITAHNAAITPPVITLSGIQPASAGTAPVTPVAITVSGVIPTTAKISSLPAQQVTLQSATVDVVLGNVISPVIVTVGSIVPNTAKSIALTPDEIAVTSVSPEVLTGFTIPACVLQVTGVSPNSSKLVPLLSVNVIVGTAEFDEAEILPRERLIINVPSTRLRIELESGTP